MSDLIVRLAIFDWAGTTVDHGSIAPITALVAAFSELGLDLTEKDARGPMGLQKRDHICELLRLPSIVVQWKGSFGREPTPADVEAIYRRFLPLQYVEAKRRTNLIPGALDCYAALRKEGIRLGTTTGYPRVIGEPVAEMARAQGFIPDNCVFPDEVAAGRPAPWMIFRNMEATGIFPAASVVKVGDTVPDIEEGRNAGVWSIGVTDTGSEIGLDLDAWLALPESERIERARAAGEKLLRAGAHAVVRSVGELPRLIDELNSRLQRGERP